MEKRRLRSWNESPGDLRFEESEEEVEESGEEGATDGAQGGIPQDEDIKKGEEGCHDQKGHRQ